MSNTQSSSEVISSSSSTAPIADHNPSLLITTHKLNGANFLQWSQSVKLFVQGKGKFGLLTGAAPAPESDDSAYPTWEAENSMLMSWLINSMEPGIGKTYLFLPTAQAVWESVTETYSDLGNASQLFDLKIRIKNAKQGSQSVTQYYTTLTGWWHECDLFSGLVWTSQTDQRMFQKMQDKERVFEFLAGLNTELDGVRGQVLGRIPFPSIREVFAEIRREESRRQVMLSDQLSPPPLQQPSESSALFSRPTEISSPPSSRRPGRPWCDHCRKPGHVKDKCWKLHGKPADMPAKFGKPLSDGKALHTTAANLPAQSSPDQQLFTKEQLEQLYSYFTSTQLASSPIPSTSYVQKCNVSTALSVNLTNDPWIIDSGASDHMTPNPHLFSTYTPSSGHLKVKVADGTLSPIAGKGSVTINPKITLQSVLHVPKLSCNLLSVNKFASDHNCIIKFFPSRCEFQDQVSGAMIGTASEHGGLYYFKGSSTGEVLQPSSLFSVSSHDSIMLWHQRLGHPSFYYLKQLFPSLFINKNPALFNCEICQFAKHHRSSFPAHIYIASKPFSLVHSDVWGPSRVTCLSGTRWFVTFIDDHTRCCWVYLLKDKSETAQVFHNFHAKIKNQFHTSIQVLRTDNGREYFNSVLGQYLLENGIIHHSSCIDTPQQNGIAERKNRHLLEVARAVMFQSNVPNRFWGDAILTATYLINRMPSKVLKFATPLSTLNMVYPENRSFSTLQPRIFGCTAFVHVLSHSRSKLDPRATKCLFLGYSATQKGYKCYDPVTHKYHVSADVTFFENQPFFPKTLRQGEILDEAIFWESVQPQHQDQPSNTVSLPIIDSPLLENELTAKPTELRVYVRRKTTASSHMPTSEPTPDQNTTIPGTSSPLSTNPDTSIDNSELPIAIRKGVRSCTQHPISKFVSYSKLTSPYKSFVSKLTEEEIPKSIQEALEVPKWKEAVLEEMGALYKNNTWQVVNLPEGVKPVQIGRNCRKI